MQKQSDQNQHPDDRTDRDRRHALFQEIREEVREICRRLDNLPLTVKDQDTLARIARIRAFGESLMRNARDAGERLEDDMAMPVSAPGEDFLRRVRAIEARWNARLLDIDEPAEAPPVEGGPLAGLVGRPLHEIERLVIEATIAAEGGSVARAARTLQVAPSTIYRKIEAWTEDGEV